MSVHLVSRLSPFTGEKTRTKKPTPPTNVEPGPNLYSVICVCREDRLLAMRSSEPQVFKTVKRESIRLVAGKHFVVVQAWNKRSCEAGCLL